MKKTNELFNKPSLNFWIILTLFLVVAVSPILDIYVSKIFYENNRFYLKDNIVFELVRTGIPEFLLLVAAAIFIIWIVGFARNKQWIAKVDTKIMALTTGSMVLGPGLIVNGIFKSFWGRARPFNTIEFGGTKLFTPPVIIANQCDVDCSFMSGHTAVGFWIFCFALLAPRKHRKVSITFAALFGVLVGVARIAQGSHFFSDVFFSAVVTTSIIIWLHYKIFPNEYDGFILKADKISDNIKEFTENLKDVEIKIFKKK